MEALIFVVEEESTSRELIKCTLESFSHKVMAFENASDMLTEINFSNPSLIIMNTSLPSLDGVSALKRLKDNPSTRRVPVILLSTKDSEVDIATGLDAGADDYILKPFGILEFSARIRAALRRNAPAKPQRPNEFTMGALRVNTGTHEVYVSNQKISLTLKEYELLKILIENQQTVLSRERLLSDVWGTYKPGATRTLDMHIQSLRQKLGDDVRHPRYIRTVRGIGYRMFSDEEM